MPDSVYRVTEVIGVSSESWEAAARSAVETAANTVRDLRVAEVVRQDVVIEEGQVTGFRVRLAISFKYDSGDYFVRLGRCGGIVGRCRSNGQVRVGVCVRDRRGSVLPRGFWVG